MARNKTKKELADAAYEKSERLRGQIDAFDGVQGQVTDHPPVFDEGRSPPPVCPHCRKRMDISVGGSWSHLRHWWASDTASEWKLQCNMCGGIVIVSKDVWTQVREAAIQAFVDRSPTKDVYEKRKKLLSKDEFRGAE